jgi:hypothetical protein
VIVQTGRRDEVSRYESLFWDTLPLIGHSVHVDRNGEVVPGLPESETRVLTSGPLRSLNSVVILNNSRGEICGNQGSQT